MVSEYVLSCRVPDTFVSFVRCSTDTRAEQNQNATEDFLTPFSNPALWSTLYHARTPPFVPVEAFGFSQPGVRRAAWSLVQTLLRVTSKGKHYFTFVQYRRPSQSCRSLCVHFARPQQRCSAFRMGRARSERPQRNVAATTYVPERFGSLSFYATLLIFLPIEYPTCWVVEGEEDGHESDAEEDSSDDEDAPKMPEKKTVPTMTAGPSPAYREFLQFLELGCSGSPVQGYPAVLIILSTIPSSVRTSAHMHV